jgi:hypothetical protein
MPMYMTIFWGADCKFVFDSLFTGEEDYAWFAIGLLLTFLFGVFTVFVKHRLGLHPHPVMYGLLCLCSILFMDLLMCLNGFVIIALLLGVAAGSTFFEWKQQTLHNKSLVME